MPFKCEDLALSLALFLKLVAILLHLSTYGFLTTVHILAMHGTYAARYQFFSLNIDTVNKTDDLCQALAL